MNQHNDWPQQDTRSDRGVAASRAAILNLPRTICEYIGDFARTDPIKAGVILVSVVWIVWRLQEIC